MSCSFTYLTKISRTTMLKFRFLTFCLLCLALSVKAQFAFELKVEYANRINNSDFFSISGTLLNGRVENGKSYYLENGIKLDIKNVISTKSATSVPVASAPEGVSLSIEAKDFYPDRGEILKGISSRPTLSGSTMNFSATKMAEGQLSCKLNGRMYTSMTISKPVLMKQADMFDLFFEAEDKSVIWLQINQFSEITNTPHQAKTDTSNHDRKFVCKVAYMPKGYRPTDQPGSYACYEDFRGNAGIIIKQIDRYHKKMAFEFSGILRPNAKMQEENPNAGIFYITEGKVDNIGWDVF